MSGLVGRCREERDQWRLHWSPPQSGWSVLTERRERWNKMFLKMFSLWRLSGQDSRGYRQWWWERRRWLRGRPKYSVFSLRFVKHTTIQHVATHRFSQSFLVAPIVLIVVEEMYLGNIKQSTTYWVSHLLPPLTSPPYCVVSIKCSDPAFRSEIIN